MKIKLNPNLVENIKISGEYIKLDSLLKYTLVVSSGGEAKMLITEGLVFVNGEVCTSRGKKIRARDIVRVENRLIRIAD